MNRFQQWPFAAFLTVAMRKNTSRIMMRRVYKLSLLWL